MIRTKRVYLPPEKADGARVLVDRLWPRGMKKERARLDLWLKEIAPSDGLRKWYSHDPRKWTEFKKRYRAELRDKKPLLKQIKDLERKTGTVTLLFGSKEEKLNNAAALAQFLKR
jgi:uncharacterized protein YeaO (DUF488 family)